MISCGRCGPLISLFLSVDYVRHVVLEQHKYGDILYEWLDLVSLSPSSEIYQADKPSSLINPVRCKEQGRKVQTRYHCTAHSPSNHCSMGSVTLQVVKASMSWNTSWMGEMTVKCLRWPWSDLTAICWSTS